MSYLFALLAIFFLRTESTQQAYHIRSESVITNAASNTGWTIGSPYFTEDYKYADITLARGRKFIGVRTRINLFNSEVQFISAAGVEAVLQAGVVKEVNYTDTTSGGLIFYKFRSGYPASDGRSQLQFYIVMADGKCQLLRCVEKKGAQHRNDITGETYTDYESTDYYYLLTPAGMKRLKRDKEFLLSEMADKQTELSAFIETNKLNLRNTDHVAKLVNYYNTL